MSKKQKLAILWAEAEVVSLDIYQLATSFDGKRIKRKVKQLVRIVEKLSDVKEK